MFKVKREHRLATMIETTPSDITNEGGCENVCQLLLLETTASGPPAITPNAYYEFHKIALVIPRYDYYRVIFLEKKSWERRLVFPRFNLRLFHTP